MDPTELWRSTRPIADACLAHPFVQGIADGSLDRQAFGHYVGQDAFFLDAFARAYALCLARAGSRAQLRAFRELLDGAVDELELHGRYAERWGVDLDPEPTAATRAYTDFLLRTAALDDLAVTCAAMTPCMRLYAWLGQQLAPTADPASAYHDWVTTYADEGFDALAGTLEALLAELGGDEVAVARAYRTAMELELAFFDSALAAGTA